MSSSIWQKPRENLTPEQLDLRIQFATIELNRLQDKWPHERSDMYPFETIQEMQNKLGDDTDFRVKQMRKKYSKFN